MKDKFIIFLSNFFKGLNDFPEVVVNEVNKTIMIGILVIICGSIYAITYFKLMIIPFALIITLLYYICFWFFWYRHFRNDSVICYDGKIIVTDVEGRKMENVARKISARYIRHSYKLQLENNMVINVIRTNRKIKPGMMIRIYTLPENIITQSDKSYLINNVLLTEIIENVG